MLSETSKTAQELAAKPPACLVPLMEELVSLCRSLRERDEEYKIAKVTIYNYDRDRTKFDDCLKHAEALVRQFDEAPFDSGAFRRAIFTIARGEA